MLFSDAVFAIAITLLVLEVRVPHLPAGAGNRELLQSVLQLLPKNVGFAVSFIVIGSENHTLGAALAIYAGSLGLVGLGKVWVWAYAVGRPQPLAPAATPTLIRRLSRRSWAVPLTCAVTANLGGAGLPHAYVVFLFIPLMAWLLDRPEARRSTKAAQQAVEADEP